MPRTLLVLILSAALLAACTRHKPPSAVNAVNADNVVKIQVDAAGYRVDGVPVETLEGVIAALRAAPKLGGLSVFTGFNVPTDRLEATIRGIRAAGIEAPLADSTGEVPSR